MNDKAYKFSTRDSTEFTVGSGLPEVTAEDNGDVLTVVEGAWAKAEPSGGGGALLVGVSSEEIDNGTRYTLDKTAREIISAFPLIYIGAEMNTPEIRAASYVPVYITIQNDVPVVSWAYYESDMPGYLAGYNFMLDAAVLTVAIPGMAEASGVYIFNTPTLDDYPTYSKLREE